jgi:hypothetical protein
MSRLWKRLGTGTRLFVGTVLMIGAVAVVTVARRDLETRDPAAVRGNPRIWDRVTRFPGGSVAYLAFGRRSRQHVGLGGRDRESKHVAAQAPLSAGDGKATGRNLANP